MSPDSERRSSGRTEHDDNFSILIARVEGLRADTKEELSRVTLAVQKLSEFLVGNGKPEGGYVFRSEVRLSMIEKLLGSIQDWIDARKVFEKIVLTAAIGAIVVGFFAGVVWVIKSYNA